MEGTTKKSAVLTFIGYKQTYKQRSTQDRQAKYIYRFIFTGLEWNMACSRFNAWERGKIGPGQ